MPVYTVECPKCGKSEDIYRTVAQIDDLPACCGVRTHRIINAPYVRGDYQPYRSMITGEMIEGRRQHNEHLKRHNCVEVGNDTSILKPRKPIPIDREKRRKKLAEVVNSKL